MYGRIKDRMNFYMRYWESVGGLGRQEFDMIWEKVKIWLVEIGEGYLMYRDEFEKRFRSE